ncbi:hypothetical protein [Roseateles amylovorans]|uniref:Uncharacterized protein n=1 Tax=Roseateles amylovorans TaxID=2978473 RepID=A0ABY6B8S9_9BURK|nr:hypothetical protein [Roseateles amylovorans]UXH79627.1 hypothetical protein N4261_06850 [Roseateles amylovorans]
MNALILLMAGTLAVLGAVLFSEHFIGWGLAIWVAAAVLSQSLFMVEVWREYRRPGAVPRSLIHAVMTCLQRIWGSRAPRKNG